MKPCRGIIKEPFLMPPPRYAVCRDCAHYDQHRQEPRAAPIRPVFHLPASRTGRARCETKVRRER